MPTPITPAALSSIALPAAKPTASPTADAGFANLLQQAVGQVQGLNANANTAVESSLVGDDLAMVETFTAVREADLAMRLMLQIRNKLVSAYQEVQQLRF